MAALVAVAAAGLPAIASPDDGPVDGLLQEEPKRQNYSTTAAAAELARETGRRVEVESERDESTTTYINPDGSSTTQQSASPTRVEQDGEFVEVDPSLQRDDGVLVPEATTADVEISDGSGAEPLARVSEAGKSLALDWSSDLPRAEVDDEDATFAAGSNRDIQVSATSNGFTLRLVLDKVPTTAPVYTLPVTTKGVRLAKTPDGGFAASDAAGKVVFRISSLKMWDAAQGTPDAPSAPPGAVSVASSLVERDGSQAIELRPDYDWMTDTRRVLPLVVDPDTYVDSAADKSTYVSSAAPSTSFGTSNTLRAGKHPSASIGVTRAYVQHTMPARVGGQVLSAKLRLHQWDAGSCTPTPAYVYPVTSLWSTAMTWSGTTPGSSKQPSITTSSAYAASKSIAHGNEGAGCNNAYTEIDVTKMVKAWLDYTPDDPFTPANEQVGIPNYGMTIRASETDTTHHKALCSAVGDAGTCVSPRGPTLTINYNTPPDRAFDLQHMPTTCFDGDLPRVTTLTPQLTARATDFDIFGNDANRGSEKVRLRFQVWPIDALQFDDPNVQDPNAEGGLAPLVVEGYSPFVEQNTPAAFTIPADKLTDDTAYAWRAIAEDSVGPSRFWSDWLSFQTNTAEAPGVNCPIRLVDNETADQATADLQDLIDTDPTAYFSAGYDDSTGKILFKAARVSGQDDATTASEALSAAMDFLRASPNLADDQKIAVANGTSAEILSTEVVSFSKADLDAVEGDVKTRREANDPVLADVIGANQDPDRNVVVITSTNVTPELQAEVESSYGSRAIVETGVEHEGLSYTPGGPFVPNGSLKYGGVRIGTDFGGGAQPKEGCSTAFPVRKEGTTNTTSSIVLTAGHCFRADGQGHRVGFAYVRQCEGAQYSDYWADSIDGRANKSDITFLRLAGGRTLNAGIYTGEGWRKNKACEKEPGILKDPPRGLMYAGYEGRKIRSVAKSAPNPTKQSQLNLCKWGSRTGFSCQYSVLSKRNNRGEVQVRYNYKYNDNYVPAFFGDSGGPVFQIINCGPGAGGVKAFGVLVNRPSTADVPNDRRFIDNVQAPGGFTFVPISRILDDYGYTPIRVGNDNIDIKEQHTCG